VDVAITELEKIEATRVDGVAEPANGIPILLLKSVAKADGMGHPPMTGTHSHSHPAFDGPDGDGDGQHGHEHDHDGDADHHHPHAAKAAVFDRDAALAAVKAIVGRKVDESPDIAGGTAVLSQIADLIIAEAQELKSGQAGEIADIQQLACAAEMIWCWRTGEESVASGSVMPATALMQSAAWDSDDPAEIAKAFRALGRSLGLPGIDAKADAIAKADLSAAGRRKSADAGHALPDGSYPIENEHDLHSAAVLARSGHGDVAAARRLIARRAKELRVSNPLDSDDDTSKGQLAGEGTSMDTVVKGSDDLAKAVADAVTKAVAPLEERLEALGGELAKVKATPVPGGPAQSAAGRQPTAADGTRAAKAAYYDQWAELVSDPKVADDYRKLAAQERAQVTAP